MGHLKKNNETYLSHLLFAGKIGLTLIFRGIIFLLHGVLPICKIPEQWNLNNTTIKLQEWNFYTIRRLDK